MKTRISHPFLSLRRVAVGQFRSPPLAFDTRLKQKNNEQRNLFQSLIARRTQRRFLACAIRLLRSDFDGVSVIILPG